MRGRYMPFKMTLRKILELTFLAFSFCACNQTSKQFGDLKAVNTTKGGTAKTLIINSDKSTKIVDSSINSDSVEDKIIDTIFKLREVKQEAKYIEKQTEGTRHLIVLIADTPHFPDKKYYWVRVSEDAGTHLATYFHFYVYPDSMRIMYYDVVNDREITLSEWRKINGM